MVETNELDSIKKSIVDIKEKQNKSVSTSSEYVESLKAYARGIFLFMSFDLADSTAFKTEHPALWSSVFANFYQQVLSHLLDKITDNVERENQENSSQKDYMQPYQNIRDIISLNTES